MVVPNFLMRCLVQRAFSLPVFFGVIMVKAPQGADLASKSSALIPFSQVTCPPRTMQVVGSSAEHGVMSKECSFHPPSVTFHCQCSSTSGLKSVPGKELGFSYKWCLTIHSESLIRCFLWSWIPKIFFHSQGEPTYRKEHTALYGSDESVQNEGCHENSFQLKK